MSQIEINTSQNVKIQFQLSGVGERILATIIDLLIKMVMFWILQLLYDFTKLSEYIAKQDYWSAGAIIAITTLPIYLYTLILESFWNGQTIGKKIMQIKVVKIDGYQASFADFLMRWILCVVDVYIFFGFIGLIMMMVSKNNQRLGDMVTSTAVISLKNKINISHTILEEISEDYQPAFPQVVMLTDNDVRIIKENYQRAISFNDQQVLSSLVEKIQTTLQIKYNKEEFSERKFIQKIILDYNYYTGK